MNTTAGSFSLLGSIVPEDAGVVKRLRKAGAIILGSLVVMFKSMDLIDIFDQERPICPNLHIFAGITRQDGLVAVVNVRTRISPTPTHVAPHRDRALLHQLDLFP